MTVCTTNITLFDFCYDSLKSVSPANHSGNLGYFLASNVIKLKNNRIGF